MEVEEKRERRQGQTDKQTRIILIDKRKKTNERRRYKIAEETKQKKHC